MNNSCGIEPEVLFANEQVEFCGQPIGIVVAKSEVDARLGAKLVKIKYTNIKKPILTIEQALEEKSFHKHPFVADHSKGDAETAIKNSIHQINGEYRMNATQFNFFLEV